MDDEIKFCFPYIHYLISATMVLSNLLSQHPNLKQHYDDVLRRAVTSLNTYCYKVWVSGKLMRTVSNIDSLVRTVLADDSKHTQQQRSQRMEHSDNNTEIIEESEWHRSSDAMDGELELAPRPDYSHTTARSDGLREDQSLSLNSIPSHSRFPVSAMADFDFEAMIMGSGGVPVTYPPDPGRRMVMMYGAVNPDGSNIGTGVFPPERINGDTAMYRPLVPQSNYAVQSTMPQGGIDPYSTPDGRF